MSGLDSESCKMLGFNIGCVENLYSAFKLLANFTSISQRCLDVGCTV
jgi:hypothetical protein